MNVFKQFKSIMYVAGNHACKRGKERTDLFPTYIRQSLQNLCKRGEIILEIDNYRYIRFKDEEYDLFFPCIEWRENIYIIKSTLTWDMVDYRLQKVIDNYHLNNFETASY